VGFARRALAVIVLGLASALHASAQNADNVEVSNELIVETNSGAVRGFEKSGVRLFLGIPYAAPPVGDLRWQPPSPL
jgi:para-nitrobenzyl esterase